MSKPKYTVYEADRSGECWDLCQTDDPAYALQSLRAGRAARPRNAFGVYETDEPERRGVEEELEELELPSLEAPPDDARCPVCDEPLRLVNYCGACQEHDRRRDDELRLAETRVILDLAEARRRTRAHLRRER